MEYLSDIELFFCKTIYKEKKYFLLEDDEFKHCIKVMRNKKGQKIYATDGTGNVYEAVITDINKESLKAEILNVKTYQNSFSDFIFCIPNLRNPERLKFALEKCTELGITNFIVFNSERSINKNINMERLNKIVLSALKQSLRTFLPEINFLKSLKDLDTSDKRVIVFDQHSEIKLNSLTIKKDEEYLFVFGPEGGLTKEELTILNPDNIIKLSENRLRSETAIIKAASILL
ncbi:MAG: RsmE family RNA methyltransferase [Ignavibacteriaceae bacterium]|nr:RsmE family RNA methyltransferase [Ignavibacteriaceae bacterium]